RAIDKFGARRRTAARNGAHGVERNSISAVRIDCQVLKAQIRDSPTQQIKRLQPLIKTDHVAKNLFRKAQLVGLRGSRPADTILAQQRFEATYIKLSTDIAVETIVYLSNQFQPDPFPVLSNQIQRFEIQWHTFALHPGPRLH